MNPDLPNSTVTFLFTDIEGSTQLWERHPEAMRAALACHDALLRSTIEANRGHIIKTTGDGLHAVFASSADSVAAVVAAQRALQGESWQETGPLRVRMALHTGEAEMREGDYYGGALNRAARLMAVGTGGQILLSQATAVLVQDRLPPEVSLADLGEHRLKDLVRPEHVFQVRAPGLPVDFPPLRSLGAFAHNLPVQLTSFVGRGNEVAEIRRLLSATRLLTLTGPGGTGKTRLSLQLAAEVLPGYADGAWLVELAPLADPSYLVPALAAVFDLRELPGRSLAALVTDYLAAKALLLLLDNCEHMIEACSRLADDLLHACPHLRILASSREGLGLAGETIYRVPSLALPGSGSASPETLAAIEAVRLFVERAQAAQPHFALTAANAAAVAAICRRLDGIPLALELAAARVKLLSAEQIAARLDDRFRLLVGGSRTALPRQQTLRALIDWSYDLLPATECRLLRQLSVFAGGWTLEAAEALGEGIDVLDVLAQLVNKSLVLVDEQGDEARYRLLETIRQYAREKLLEAGESEDARNRHLAFFLDFAEAAAPKLYGRDMIAVLDQLQLEQDNLRAAMEWSLETEPLAALRLSAALWMFWGRRVSMMEGLDWVRTALARTQAAPPLEGEAQAIYQVAKANALQAEASLYFGLGDNRSARTAVEASIDLARQIRSFSTLAVSLGTGASVSAFMGDVATAQAWAEEGLAVSRQQNFYFGLATLAGFELFLAAITGAPMPPGMLEEMLRVAKASENPWALALALQNAGRVAALSGDTREALARYEQASVLFQQLRDRPFQTGCRSEIGHVLRQSGRYDEAMIAYRETLHAWRELGQRAAIAHELESVGFIAAATGQDERAAILFGAAEALRESIGSSMTPIERREYDVIVSQLHAQADTASLQASWTQGRTLSMDEAIQLAVEEPSA